MSQVGTSRGEGPAQVGRSLRGRDPDRSAPLLEAVAVTKTYAAVQALKQVDVTIEGGTVHGLIGANGAGKSTFIRTLAGAVQPDAGTIRVDGREVQIRDPHDATDLGFAFLHQELNLVAGFSALENMSLGVLGRGRLGLADRTTAYRRARAVADDIGFDFPLDRPVQELTVGQRGLIALGRSLMRRARARLIAFDEPTASLSAPEAERLFDIIRRLAADGVAVLYVSHRLDEVAMLCQRVTAFRDGAVTADLCGAEITKQAMIHEITGGVRDAVAVASSTASNVGDVVLEARHVSRAPSVHDVSLSLRRGEVVGLAGLVGAGRTELASLLFGVDRRDGGELLLDGRPVTIDSPSQAMAHGIGLVPEERRSQGLFLDKDAVFNINAGAPRALRVRRGLGLVRPSRARARARDVAERVDLQPRNLGTPVRHLSGGNQQKLVLGRWLLDRPRVLLLDEPTRGIDVGARAQIHHLLRQLADDGLALLVISSDFEELVHCDRVLVMAHGRLVAELTGDAITERQMLHAAYDTGNASEKEALS